MKKSFQTEMDDTQQAVSQIVCLCTTIALHQEFGVGKTRLDRITDRINELEDQNTEVIMTPDANGRPSKARAEAIRESWLAVTGSPYTSAIRAELSPGGPGNGFRYASILPARKPCQINKSPTR